MITGIGVRVPGGVGTEAFCSGLDPAGTEPGRIAVSIGTAVGCTTSLDREYEQTSHGGSRWLVDHTRTVEQIFDYFITSPNCADINVKLDTGAEVQVCFERTGCNGYKWAAANQWTVIATNVKDDVLYYLHFKVGFARTGYVAD